MRLDVAEGERVLHCGPEERPVTGMGEERGLDARRERAEAPAFFTFEKLMITQLMNYLPMGGQC